MEEHLRVVSSFIKDPIGHWWGFLGKEQGFRNILNSIYNLRKIYRYYHNRKD